METSTMLFRSTAIFRLNVALHIVTAWAEIYGEYAEHGENTTGFVQREDIVKFQMMKTVQYIFLLYSQTWRKLPQFGGALNKLNIGSNLYTFVSISHSLLHEYVRYAEHIKWWVVCC